MVDLSRHNNTSLTLTGDLTYIQTISQLQKNPDAWHALLVEILHLPEGADKQRILKFFYNQAKKVLDMEQHKFSESYAKILVSEAMHVGVSNVDDARELFEHAVNMCRRIPVVHLALAQFELNQGRKNKALKALQSGLTLTSEEVELKTAVIKVNNGETAILSASNTAMLTAQLTARKNSMGCEELKSGSILPKLTLKPTSTYTMAEVLDLPSSPCSAELNKQIKPGVKRHQHHLVKPLRLTINITTPKTPVLTCGSTTKSITGTYQQQPRTKKGAKENNDASSSIQHFGKPQRILCLKQRTSEHESDEELGDCIFKRKKARTGSPLMESPLLKENKRPPEPMKETTVADAKERMPSPHCSEVELQEWFHENKILRIHEKPYIIIKELGFGGSSKVYEALDPFSKAIKAIKQVNLRGCDISVKDGFINEIKFLQRLKGNKNIIDLYDHEITSQSILMVMECGSTDLAKLMHQHKTHKIKLEAYEVWYFWKKMLSAVKTIHDHGVIHHDLKPANFLLVKGNLKLIDFGIASSLQADATSIIKDTQFGTLNYMAPETIMDMSGGFQASAPKFKVGPSADVWSLGCILYFMMYGRTPFQHISHQSIKLNAITNPACRIDFGDYSDTKLLHIVKSCLQRDPKVRPKVEHLLAM